MKTFQQREQEAIRLIIKFGKTWMLYDNDAIGTVMNTIEMVNINYKPELSSYSTYLFRSVKNTFIKLNKQRIRHKHLDMVDVPSNNESDIFDYIQECQFLSDAEKQLILKRYRDNMTYKLLAQEYKITKQGVHKRMQELIAKLRRHKNVLEEKN